MYDILQLNDMLVPELLDIAEQLKISNAKKLDKQELVYKILDKQVGWEDWYRLISLFPVQCYSYLFKHKINFTYGLTAGCITHSQLQQTTYH